MGNAKTARNTFILTLTRDHAFKSNAQLIKYSKSMALAKSVKNISMLVRISTNAFRKPVKRGRFFKRMENAKNASLIHHLGQTEYIVSLMSAIKVIKS